MNIQEEQNLMLKMLNNTNTIAVIGLSDNTNRTSYQIAKAMQKAGYRIIPVNPNVDKVLGEKAYPTVLDIEENFELVNVFRRSEYLEDLAVEIAKTKAPYVWLQQGVVNENACQYLEQHGKSVIMDRCIKVAHSVLVRK
ncbi:CoA-binding protein [Gracilibacillus oryzae]|uniref:CoA-binding protein n=2 Tax=Gracilibacillus oryzae TaxID=1672701 RepID=A0A7C8KU02_9BACI|nr:CoA-binding protein [Gracilibacillus oryzae]